MKVLIVGCGSIGKRHIANLLSLGIKNMAAFDIQEPRREEVRKRFDITTPASLEDAWAGKPEVIVIAAPTSLHVPLALEAAQRGCHLFIEKPLSHNMENVSKLLQAVQEKKLVTLVGCNMRFHPGIIKVKELLEEDAIGHITAAQVAIGQYLPDWHPWEDYRRMYSARQEWGGGIILDAIHEVDYIRWMLGEVQLVACFAGKLSHLEIETEDTAAILLLFANSAIGELHLDYIQRAYSRSCHIIGEEGTVRWDYTDGQVRWYSARTHQWQHFPNPDNWEPNQMYVDEMAHFLRCLAGEEKPMLDVFEAKKVLEVALAAKKAAQEYSIIRVKE